jgi:hypothetical protein
VVVELEQLVVMVQEQLLVVVELELLLILQIHQLKELVVAEVVFIHQVLVELLELVAEGSGDKDLLLLVLEQLILAAEVVEQVLHLLLYKTMVLMVEVDL